MFNLKKSLLIAIISLAGGLFLLTPPAHAASVVTIRWTLNPNFNKADIDHFNLYARYTDTAGRLVHQYQKRTTTLVGVSADVNISGNLPANYLFVQDRQEEAGSYQYMIFVDKKTTGDGTVTVNPSGYGLEPVTAEVGEDEKGELTVTKLENPNEQASGFTVQGDAPPTITSFEVKPRNIEVTLPTDISQQPVTISWQANTGGTSIINQVEILLSTGVSWRVEKTIGLDNPDLYKKKT